MVYRGGCIRGVWVWVGGWVGVGAGRLGQALRVCAVRISAWGSMGAAGTAWAVGVGWHGDSTTAGCRRVVACRDAHGGTRLA